ncbi:MAG TPA: lytic transglycosylase domain-containing protein [Blastocatellia bacterium]|nr:lytic transglycosylase domain-containing protein [Blastocatellia bacterium]
MFKSTALVFLMAISAPAQHMLDRGLQSVRERASVYEPYIARAAAHHGIDPSVLWAIAYIESGFNPRVVSRKGARGMMQFMPATARRYGLADPHDPLRSIEAAARYVRDLSALFNGRIDLVLAGYNAGENAVIKAGYRVPRFRETRNYVARGASVLKSLRQAGMFKPMSLAASDASSGGKNSASSRSIYNGISSPTHSKPASTHSRSIYFSRY